MLIGIRSASVSSCSTRCTRFAEWCERITWSTGFPTTGVKVGLFTAPFVPFELYISQYGVRGSSSAVIGNVFQASAVSTPDSVVASSRPGAPSSSS